MKRSLSTILVTFAFLFFITSSSFASVSIFNKNLRQGDQNADVLMLQKFLKVKQTGYFGPLTRSAVIKFQESYRAEILTPAGLSYGTGFVGPATREKLNQLATVGDSILSLPISASPAASPSSALLLFGADPYTVKTGGKVTIKGFGFTPESNTVYFNDIKIDNLTSLNSLDISVQLPQSIVSGKYKIRVVNKNGDSDTIRKTPVYLNVSTVEVVRPVLQSVMPASVMFGDEVSITGTGFSQDGNTVFSSFGSSTESSSNNVIKFNTSHLTGLKTFQDLPLDAANRKISVPLFVINKAGIPSENLVFLEIKF